MIIDAIEFFSELDILEIRLNLLDPIVDYFIISESIKTHTGLDKPLYYQDNKKRFAKFAHKIISQIVYDTPQTYTNLNPELATDDIQKLIMQKVIRDDFWPHDNSAYGRDAWEKESIIKLMFSFCNPDDIIMFSDADEIPNPETVRKVIDNFNPNEIYNLHLDHYVFYFNCLKEDYWLGNTILTFDKFEKLSVCGLRKYRRGINVENGGWHFSFMGGDNRVINKIESYGEQSINTPNIKNNIHSIIENCINNGCDLLGRPCKYNIVPDSYLPQYIIENKDRFMGYFK